MAKKLNLASNPFRNRTLPWTVTTLITVVSIIALVFIAKWTFQTKAQAQKVEGQVAELRKQIDALSRHADQIKTALTPEQQRTLKSAHTLVDRKRFSWTRLFADLESFLPGTVRVSRIVVKDVATEGDRTVADLNVIVVCKNSATITQMIQDMEREGIFHAELVNTNLQRGRGETGTEYEMNVHYAPRAGVPLEGTQRNNRPVDTAGNNAGKEQ